MPRDDARYDQRANIKMEKRLFADEALPLDEKRIASAESTDNSVTDVATMQLVQMLRNKSGSANSPTRPVLGSEKRVEREAPPRRRGRRIVERETPTTNSRNKKARKRDQIQCRSSRATTPSGQRWDHVRRITSPNRGR